MSRWWNQNWPKERGVQGSSITNARSTVARDFLCSQRDRGMEVMMGKLMMAMAICN